MPRDAEATRRRLLAAGTDEFAQHGIAGARVDRIATRAGANKNLLYLYFGGKEVLFDAVFDAQVVRTTDAVPFDADDLPGYAGRLFDNHAARPEMGRLVTWHLLERSGTDGKVAAILASNRAKLEAITAAQRDGRLTSDFEPVQLLVLVVSIAGMWRSAVPEHLTLLPKGKAGVALQRRTVVDAVARLTGQPAPESH